MAEQLIERGDTYRIYTSDARGISVPYLPMEGRFGQRDHGYIDLRDKPGAVAKIAEAEGQPGLAVFLTAVNAAGSGLMSLACSVELAPVRAGAAAPENGPPPSHFVDSTVLVVTRDFRLATGDNMLAVARAWISLRRSLPEEWAAYEFGVVRTKSLFGVAQLAALSIRIRAMGIDAPTALDNFNFHWTQLAAAARKLKIGEGR